MTDPTPTPNLHLQPINANRRTWADLMNTNLRLIDAVVGTFFVVQNLQGAWKNSTAYTAGQAVVDTDTSVVYQCQIAHTSSAIPATFAEDRTAHTSYWTVYSSPARSRGVWTTNTSYALNDFVVSGSQYAICIQTNVSGATFAADVAANKWSVLVDLSAVGSAVLPVPGGAADANKFTVLNALGTGYTIVTPTAALGLFGATSIGISVLQAGSTGVALGAIGAQPAGNYQPLAASLTTLAGFTIGAYADDILVAADAAGLRTVAGLGTLATLSPSAPILAYLTTPATAAQLTNNTDIASTGYADRIGVQQTVSTITGALATGTTLIPLDDTIPQNTEGDQYMSLAITPKSATSKLVIEVVFVGSTNVGSDLIVALFQDATTNALAAVASYIDAASGRMTITLRYVMVSGTISATTFKVRAGGSNAGTLTFNGSASARLFGGVMASSIVIKEIGA